MQLNDEDIKTREVLDWQGLHLIHFFGSSCSQKTRIFMNLKGINWNSHHLNLARQENYRPWFLGINPRGLVPVLVHDGAVHIESNDILTYLDDTFPENKLIPDNDRGALIAGLDEEDSLHLDIRTLTMRFVFPKFLAQKKPRDIEIYESDQGTVAGESDTQKEVELKFWKDYARHGITDTQAEDAANNFKNVLDRFDEQLKTSRYLAGDKVTLLDIAWFIYVNRLSAATYPIQNMHPHVFTWYQELLNREEFAKEVQAPTPVRLISSALHLGQKLTGRTLANVAF